jgi:hypothetical protein
MHLKSTRVLLVSCFLASARLAVASPPTDPCTLPQSLQREVMSKYPGGSVVTVQDLPEDDRDLFQKDHGNVCPGVIKVDFYGDGKPTFAFSLIHKTATKLRTELIVAHEVARKWETVSLEKTESTIPVLWSQDPGEYENVYGDKRIRATKPVIVFCEYNAWAILYAWIGNSVDKIWLQD